MQLRTQGAQALGGIQEQTTQLGHFAAPTTWQQGHHGALLCQTQLAARLGAVGLQRDIVGQRVADEAHRHLVLGVELCLEREQGQHQIAGIADLEHALLPPGPHRGADIVNGLDAGLTQLEFDTKVERQQRRDQVRSRKLE